MNRKTRTVLCSIIGIASLISLSACGSKPASVSEPVKDSTVVWDKQIRGSNTYLLVRNLVGFQDVMEGVVLYRYPNELDQKKEKYNEKYKIFDEGVEDMDRDPKLIKPVSRSVVSAKLDLENKKVTVKFNRGASQTIDVSKYAL